MKREVIFEIPNTSEYRVVCRYGYDNFISYVWWGHLQQKVYYKKYIFVGETKWKWHEIDRCWWSKNIETMEELKRLSHKFFDEMILLPQRLDRQAMEL